MINLTKEQQEFLINNNYMRTAQELTDLFNKKFNANLKTKNILYFRKNHKLKCGLTGKFTKRSIPHNKGKKWDDYMSKKMVIFLSLLFVVYA